MIRARRQVFPGLGKILFKVGVFEALALGGLDEGKIHALTGDFFPIDLALMMGYVHPAHGVGPGGGFGGNDEPAGYHQKQRQHQLKQQNAHHQAALFPTKQDTPPFKAVLTRPEP